MFGQPLSSAHMSVPQCFLPGHEGLPPGGVGLVLAWVNQDEVLDGATENAHGWGKVGVPVKGVSVLQHVETCRCSANLGLQCYLL